MTLNFKNKHIFFCLENIWNDVDYRFQYHINQLVTANSTEDFVQSVAINDTTLIQIYREVSGIAEGVAKATNQEMLDTLQPQLMAASNMAAVMAGTAAPNEASRALIGIDKINQSNAATVTAKILNGKTQILA